MNDEIVNKKRLLLIMIPVLILIIGIAIYIGSLSNNQQTLIESQIADQTNEGKISVNGFSHLYFKANALEQEVNFMNPTNNTCTMSMSLFLNDGTLLWNCDNVQPGNVVKKITLSSALPEGEYYNCALQIQCFNTNGTELNGCNICCTIVAE